MGSDYISSLSLLIIALIIQKECNQFCIKNALFGNDVFKYKIESKKISKDQELIQSDPISCPQNQKGNN